MGKGSHYVESDGNGGFLVSKSIAYLTILTLLITLLTSVITATTYTVTNREKIINLEMDYGECKTNTELNHESIELVNRNIVKVNSQVENIDKNIDELKSDLKYFIQSYK